MSTRSLRKRELGVSKMAGNEKVSKIRVRKGTAGSYKKGKGNVYEEAPSSSKPATKRTMEFLRELPSYNKDNFSNFQPDSSYKPAVKKAKKYVPTEDHPSEQLIVTEKSTIHLKFLQQQYERKKAQMKHDAATAGPSGVSSARKKSRM